MNESATVLVVDDTPQNVKLLTDLLVVNGYRVEAAQSGEEALEKIAASIPDIVLLDVMMPGLSGYDVCRKIRQTPATALLPVVMVTSLDPQSERVHGIESTAHAALGPASQSHAGASEDASVACADSATATEARTDAASADRAATRRHRISRDAAGGGLRVRQRRLLGAGVCARGRRTHCRQGRRPLRPA